jgi:hypothetical protein
MEALSSTSKDDRIQIILMKKRSPAKNGSSVELWVDDKEATGASLEVQRMDAWEDENCIYSRPCTGRISART